MILDDKTKVALAGFLGTIVVQLLKAKSIEWIDAATANTLCLAIVGLAATLIAGHAHVEHGDTIADGHIEAAAVAARPTVEPPKS